MDLRQLTDKDITWLDANKNADVNSLWLKYHGDTDMEFLITQLQCRKKARGKLKDGIIDNHFIYPNALAVEQCSGSNMAALHASFISPADRVLDMTMGLGIDAMTISKACRSIVMIDLKQDNVEAARLNMERLSLRNATAICGDSIEYLSKAEDGAFDVIFIDPARRGKNGQRLYALGDCEPNVINLLPLALKKAKRMIIKASPMLDIDKMVTDLAPYHTDIIVTGSATECKEVIAAIDFDKPRETDDYSVRCIVPDVGQLMFRSSNEDNAISTFEVPKAEMKLFEPSAVLLKSGCFNLLSQRYNLPKISPSTHLYLSSAPITDLNLGNWWNILEVISFDKISIKNISRRYPSISISTRNFPIDADTLRHRLKVSENSGRLKLWGTTDHEGRKCIIIGERIQKNIPAHS